MLKRKRTDEFIIEQKNIIEEQAYYMLETKNFITFYPDGRLMTYENIYPVKDKEDIEGDGIINVSYFNIEDLLICGNKIYFFDTHKNKKFNVAFCSVYYAIEFFNIMLGMISDDE